MHYQYDGTFFGFLTAVHEAYMDGTGCVEGIENELAGESLFGRERVIVSDFGKAERVMDAFLRECGNWAAHLLYCGFLSEKPGIELLLFRYICLAFRLKKQLYVHQRDPVVWEIKELARKTENESYRMLGLLRFSELADGMLYAEFKPDHNVVPLIVSHFVSRMKNEEWVIHDIRRHTAAYYDTHHVIMVKVQNAETNIQYSGTEKEFRRLWCEYYRHIAIKERLNPDLRRSFMPKKYWSCITEISGSE